MDLESDEEEEWDRQLRKAEKKLNLHLNTPSQFEESEDDGSDEVEVVEVDPQGEPMNDPLIGVNEKPYSSRFPTSASRGGRAGDKMPQGEETRGPARDPTPQGGK